MQACTRYFFFAPAVGRPACYSVLGDWLAGQSQVLIALWDGGPGNGPGGNKPSSDSKKKDY